MRRLLIIALFTVFLVAIPQMATGDLNSSERLIEDVDRVIETSLKKPEEIPNKVTETVYDVIALVEEQIPSDAPTGEAVPTPSPGPTPKPSSSPSPSPRPSEQEEPSERPTEHPTSNVDAPKEDIFVLSNSTNRSSNEDPEVFESTEPNEFEVTETEVKIDRRVITRLFNSIPWWIYLVIGLFSAIAAWAVVKKGFARAATDRAMARLGYYRRVHKLHEEEMIKHGVVDQLKKKNLR